ncbi:MAG TPA: diaminopimelate decarboxylase [Rhizomicrobium sp.]|jgi:diaminopimelate decarboxylase|nr:diaminopimelate decarboxylase [Rhizomicrobium sp.]
MNHFTYRHGRLHAEDVDLVQLAKETGTPAYVYSTATLERHYNVFATAFPADALIAYSVKANGNLAVLKTLARLGAGADVVSSGELEKALIAGIPPWKIVFSGVGKTQPEMARALEAGIYQFNVESEPELEALNEVANSLDKTAPVTIRVNPDIDALTNAKITTGTSEVKFGIPWRRARDAYRLAASLSAVKVVGVDVHIGSQITSLQPFEQAFERIAELIGQLRADGHEISRADFGGGLGVPYGPAEPPPPDPLVYAKMIARLGARLGVSLILEPGRLIVANAGVLLSRVIYVKRGEARSFLIIDAGMNDLIRPALYDAHHEIVPVAKDAADNSTETYDIVGPVCETTDLFARDRNMPRMKSGELVAILTAGAYGAVMASAYNARPPAPEVLVRGSEWSVVRPRMRNDELARLDLLPAWLEN